MKKAIFGIFALVLLFSSSCKKNTSSINSGGTWTFQSVTYTNSLGGSISNGQEADVGCTNPSGDLTMWFSPSVATGHYLVLPQGHTTAGSYVTFELEGSVTNSSYYPTGGGGNEMVNVTVGNNGATNIVGSNIMMSSGYHDSSTLTINVTIP